jgi:endonuclease/exonuclease/phosphatase (EEP) superfamily protein YafD
MRAAADRRAFLALAVLACAALTCARGRPARAPEAGPADLVVMTYNVNFGLEGDPETLGAIRAGAADVVFLQETSAGWERSLRAAFTSAYPHMLFQHSPTWPAGGLGVMSRHPFELRDVSPSPAGFFFAWRVVLHTSVGDVQALDVHLRPPISDDGSVVSGHFSTPPVRRREMEAHLRHLAAGMPSLIVGDFNEDEDGAAASLLPPRGMESALPSFAPGATTWRWPVGPFTLTRRFDHVFYEPAAWACLDARVLDRGRSDHLPVVVKLKRKSR